MNTNMLLVALVALAGTFPSTALAGRQGDPRHPAWIAGEWGDVKPGTAEPDCGDHSILYDATGHFELASLLGTWEYRDGQLCTRQLLEEVGSPEPRYEPGPLECQPVRRDGARLTTLIDGRWAPMGRCGPGVINAASRRLADQAERRRRRAASGSDR